MVKMVAKMDQVMAKLQSIRCGHRTDKVWTFAFHASVDDEETAGMALKMRFQPGW
jgi:hypothetical protein